MEPAQLISATKDVIVAIAAVVTATIAVLGLRKWRTELRGKVDFEIARGLARATYRLRNMIQAARSPLIRGTEFPAAYHEKQRHTNEEEAQAWSHIYTARWAPVAEALQELEAQALEAEALWGPEIRDRVIDLRKCAQALYISFEAIVEDKRLGGEDFKGDREFGRQVQADAHASIDSRGPVPLPEALRWALPNSSGAP